MPPNMDPKKMAEMQKAYAEAMKDPETAKKVKAQMAQMQGMMSNPMVQQQMQAMPRRRRTRTGGKATTPEYSTKWMLPA